MRLRLETFTTSGKLTSETITSTASSMSVEQLFRKPDTVSVTLSRLNVTPKWDSRGRRRIDAGEGIDVC